MTVIPVLLRTLRRPLTLYAAVLLWVAALLFIFFVSPNFRGSLSDGKSTPAGDYLQFYLAAKMVTSGFADQLYNFSLQQSMQRDPQIIPFSWAPNTYLLFIYPPFVAGFFIPLSLLPFMTSAIVWLLCMALCGLSVLHLLSREYPVLRPYFGGLLIASLIFRPAVHAIYSCQNSTLTLLLFTSAFLLLKRRWDFVAGVVLALVSFKPQLLLMVGLAILATQSWRVFYGLCVTGVFLALGSLLVSVQASTEYLLRVPELSRWIEMPGMQLAGMSCWYGFFRLLLSGQSLPLIQLCAAVMSLISAAIVIARLRATGLRDEVSWSMVSIATLLISPHLLSYDLTLLALPCLLLLGTKQGWGLAAALYVSAIVSPGVAEKLAVQPVVLVMFVALLLLRRAPQPAIV